MNYCFDKKWFKRYQRTLLWFLNQGVLKYWFRRVLRINKDCSFKSRIIDIQPNSFAFAEKGVYKRDFRTHNKFSKRLFYAFKPLWYLCHYWDILIANQLKPAWNLGFDTLTVYPDPNTGATTVDGRVERSGTNLTWANIRDGAGTVADNVQNPTYLVVLGSGTNAWALVRRGILLFDTSALPDDATITSATFSVYPVTIVDYFNQLIGLVASTPASDNVLIAADFTQLGTTRYATDLDLGSMTTGQYNNWILNGAGISAVSKTGITKLGLRMSGDIDNSEPSHSSTLYAEMRCNMAEQTGTDKDPKLVVIYTPAAAGPADVKSVNGVAIADVKSINGVAIADVKSINGIT